MPDTLSPEELQGAIQNYTDAVRSITETFLDKGIDPRTLGMVLHRTADALGDVHTSNMINDIVTSLLADAFAKAGLRPEQTTKE